MARASIYEFAGGEQAFLALAAATHERCLADPELNHPFSHHVSPGHIEHLAAYWAEVFGGPRRYSESLGGHSGMLSIHAGEDAPDEMGDRFEACFIQAIDDPEFVAIYLEYDAAFDWPADDPRLDALAERAERWLVRRAGGRASKRRPDADPGIAELIAASTGSSSPAWDRLKEIARERMSRMGGRI